MLSCMVGFTVFKVNHWLLINGEVFRLKRLQFKLQKLHHQNIHKIVLISFITLLVGCASSVKTATKLAEVIYDPEVQVGSNENQPSIVSVSVLTENTQTTVSKLKKRNFFDAKVPKGKYLVSIYELNKDYRDIAKQGKLSAKQVSTIISGEYLEKHEHYLKTTGYRFIQHFKLAKQVSDLLAVVYFEEPECTVWSPLHSVKGVGEEYNFYMRAKKRYFIFQSDLDISVPGNGVKIENRFLGQCGEQLNALAVSPKVSQPVQAFTNSSVAESKTEKTKAIEQKTTKQTIVEDYSPKLIVAKTNKAAPVQSSLEGEQKIVTSNQRENLDKKGGFAKRSVLKNMTDVIKVLISNNIENLVSDANDSTKLPAYRDKSDNQIYFVTGAGIVNTRGKLLNIRSGAGIQFKRTSTVRAGKSVQVLQYAPIAGGWLLIESEGVQSGWVSEKLVNWYWF